MESLQPEVAPFGIHTTIVNPGFFRTELLTQESTTYAEPSIEDYAERHAAQREWYEAQNGQQAGDPAKLAQALITIAGQEPPPRRFIAGADAIAIAEQKVQICRSRSTPIATYRPRSDEPRPTMLGTGGRLCDTASSPTWPRSRREPLLKEREGISRGKPFINFTGVNCL